MKSWLFFATTFSFFLIDQKLNMVNLSNHAYGYFFQFLEWDLGFSHSDPLRWYKTVSYLPDVILLKMHFQQHAWNVNLWVLISVRSTWQKKVEKNIEHLGANKPGHIGTEKMLQLILTLKIPDNYDAKIAKICNPWTFWHVIQPMNNLFKIQQKAFCPMLHRCKGFLEHWAKGFLSDFEKMVY